MSHLLTSLNLHLVTFLATYTVNTPSLTCERNHNLLETPFLPQPSSGTRSFFPREKSLRWTRASGVELFWKWSQFIFSNHQMGTICVFLQLQSCHKCGVIDFSMPSEIIVLGRRLTWRPGAVRAVPLHPGPHGSPRQPRKQGWRKTAFNSSC